MPNRANLSLAAALGFAGLLLGAAFANAQTIVGIASQNFCSVAIVTCNQSPEDSCPLQFNGSMAQGQSFTSNTGRLCYKRENRPGDCASGQMVSWNCATRTISGSENFSIQ